MFKNGDDILAMDLLMDIEQYGKVHPFIDSNNYKRLFEYLLNSVMYAGDNIEQNSILECLTNMAANNNDLLNGMRVAIRRNDQ